MKYRPNYYEEDNNVSHFKEREWANKIKATMEELSKERRLHDFYLFKDGQKRRKTKRILIVYCMIRIDDPLPQ